MAYGMAILVVVFILLWQGNLLNVIAVIPGHFILRILGAEKQFEEDDKRGDLSVAVGKIFLAAAWIVAFEAYRWWNTWS